ncbi:MAG TPA: type I DNA topoisomerase [Phycisphaerae bacterium]|nr:type I DNA topoisomerase [Phycisphaerae bacterium]
MTKALVIVESPAKARTISKFLGDGFAVESSIGHIRDLPSSAAEIPAQYKEEPWARLGVNVEEEFKPLYVVPKDKKAQVTKLRNLLKNANELYLATDEDREGEAIAWHLVQVLNPKVPVRRMVFDEITRQAITNAVKTTRDIDQQLVSAQETRRILDRLYGYEVSPVLWRKIGPKLSAGRVQSVATRLIVDRERARMAFVAAGYWDLDGTLRTNGDSAGTVDVRLIELAAQRVASGKDFDETTGKLKNAGSVRLLDETTAQRLADHLRGAEFTVSDVAEKPFTSRPYAPFITSTLQQEAGRKLRFSAQRTMRVAQNLYENGYITYMRTDSTQLSTQAIDAARNQIRALYGDDYLPDSPRHYTSKSKNAQEAHEAIRPAGDAMRTPKSLAGELESDALKLYELIWKRTVASQMKDAHGLRTSVKITADGGSDGAAVFTASGKVIRFAGYLRAYVEGSDDPQADLEDQEKILPPLSVGQKLAAERIEAAGHTTQPPARFTEASLIRELEERGIGRPSTYAAIIQTIQDRGYVWKKATALVPTFTAFAVVNLLEQHLSVLVDFAFTAKLEDTLDAIANGQREAGPWLHDFYFGDGHVPKNGDPLGDVGLKNLIGSGWEEIDARAVCSVPLGQTEDGRTVTARVGRYGPYVQMEGGEERATIPNDIPPDELTVARALELLEQAAKGDRVLGQDPNTGKPVYLKAGRFGPYVQLGDPELTEKGNIKRGSKPKMASLWPGMSMDTISLDEAVLLLSFPRVVGKHPETGEEITAQDGKYGPYLRMGTDSRSLENHEKLQSVTVDEAVEIFKQPKRGRRQAGAGIIAELGQHPQSEAKLQVKSGRFGPYVTDGVVNATIPKGYDPASVTLEKAVELIAAREQKLRDQGKDPRAPKAKKTKKTTSRSASGKSDTSDKASDSSAKKRKTTKKKSTKRAKAKRVPAGSAAKG